MSNHSFGLNHLLQLRMLNDKATAMNDLAIVKQSDASCTKTAGLSSKTPSRREVLVGSVAVGAILVLRGERAAAADGKKTFTILHTNDLHSNLIGMAPASDYTPFSRTMTKLGAGSHVWVP